MRGPFSTSPRFPGAAGRRALVGLCLLLCLGRGVAATPTPLEVRALYLYNFSLFVTWPQSAFDAPGAPLRYCVVGNPALARLLARLVKGEAARGHPLQIVERPSSFENCHLLYLDHSLGERIGRILAAVRARPVLTVGDSEAFVRAGGMVGLVRQGRRIRPVIDRAPVAAARIHISSKLLRLARLIGKEP